LPGTYRYPFYKKGGVLKGQNGLPSYETRKIFDNVYDPNAGLEGLDQSFIDNRFNRSLMTNLENSNIPNA